MRCLFTILMFTFSLTGFSSEIEKVIQFDVVTDIQKEMEYFGLESPLTGMHVSYSGDFNDETGDVDRHYYVIDTVQLIKDINIKHEENLKEKIAKINLDNNGKVRINTKFYGESCAKENIFGRHDSYNKPTYVVTCKSLVEITFKYIL